RPRCLPYPAAAPRIRARVGGPASPRGACPHPASLRSRYQGVMKRRHQVTGARSLLVATRLRANAGAVSRARAAIDRLALPIQHPERGFDLRLLVSEVVANAIKHGAAADASILLSVEQVGTTVRVAVEDAGPLFTPEPTERPAPGATSGRGLYLLTAL